MKADDISLEDFLSSNKTRFIIPVYQRNYDWKEKNCQQLLDDIEQLSMTERKSHFLGSIVYVTNSDTDSIDLREYVVIDGQQRLTTATLFLKALHDSSDDENLKEEILESFLINKRLSEQNKLKLKPIKKDDEAFTKLLKNDFYNINQTSNIYRNYMFFKTKIAETKDCLKLFNGFKKLFIVHIALNRRDDNPQLIFESINSTGVSLSQADLIRNFLLMDKEANEQNELFEQFWLKIEDNLTSELISMFVRDYLTMKQKKIPNKDDIYEAFKKFVFENGFQTKTLMIELLEYSRIYKTFLFDSNEIYANSLKNLRQLKIGVVYPLLLPLVKNYKDGFVTGEELLNTFKVIEAYVVRRAVCNKPANALNKIFAGLHDEIINIKNFNYGKFSNFFVSVLLSKKGSGIFPSDDEFRSEFCSRDAYNLKNIRYILLSLENNNNNERVDGAILTIEHVMPQVLSNTWKVKLGDKFQSVHDNFVHNIGNLTLSGDNSQLSNNSFEEKRTVLEGQSSLRLNRYFSGVESWNATEISKRANHLFSEAAKIWGYPKELIVDIQFSDESKEFYTLDDEIDIAGKKQKPNYFELLGERVQVVSWSELFVKFSEKLLQYDEETFSTLLGDDNFVNNKKKVFSTVDDGSMRKSAQIGKFLYLEKDFSANTIINYIKLICEKFGLSGDDFVYAVQTSAY